MFHVSCYLFLPLETQPKGTMFCSYQKIIHMRFMVSSNAIISNLAVKTNKQTKKKKPWLASGKPPSQLKNSAFPSLLPK